MARSITGRQNIIGMQGMHSARPGLPPYSRFTYFALGGYHGRTYGAMAVTKSKTVYSEGFFPLMVGCSAELQTCTPFPF